MYFEKQVKKNCAIHSLNNALGYPAIQDFDVINYIRSVANIINRIDPSAAEDYVESHMDPKKETDFSPLSVWQAAILKGVIDPPFELEFVELQQNNNHLILLGRSKTNAFHAIAVKDGLLFDSESHDPNPVPANVETVKDAIGDVLEIYAVPEKKQSGHNVKYSSVPPTFI